MVRSTAGIVPWQKQLKVLLREAEPVVPGEELDRLRVGRRAGHEVPREPHAIEAPQGKNLLGVPLEERFPRDRADGEHPLRMIEPEPRSLASGDEDHADPSGLQGLGAFAACCLWTELVALLAHPERRWRDSAIGQGANLLPARPPATKPLKEPKIDLPDLGCQGLLLGARRAHPKTPASVPGRAAQGVRAVRSSTRPSFVSEPDQEGRHSCLPSSGQTGVSRLLQARQEFLASWSTESSAHRTPAPCRAAACG